MFLRVTSTLTAGLWAIALSAQTAPPKTVVIPSPQVMKQQTEQVLRDFVKKFDTQKTTVCSIPLLQVVPPGNVVRMPTVAPPVEPEPVDHMPKINVPAPPCQEKER